MGSTSMTNASLHRDNRRCMLVAVPTQRAHVLRTFPVVGYRDLRAGIPKSATCQSLTAIARSASRTRPLTPAEETVETRATSRGDHTLGHLLSPTLNSPAVVAGAPPAPGGVVPAALVTLAATLTARAAEWELDVDTRLVPVDGAPTRITFAGCRGSVCSAGTSRTASRPGALLTVRQTWVRLFRSPRRLVPGGIATNPRGSDRGLSQTSPYPYAGYLCESKAGAFDDPSRREPHLG